MNEPSNQSDLAKSVDQLRGMVCGLGLILFLVSLSFTGFVWKQSRLMSSLTAARREQLVEGNEAVKKLGEIVNDLSVYSNNRPDLSAILRNHGVEIKNANTTPAPPASTPKR